MKTLLHNCERKTNVFFIILFLFIFNSAFSTTYYLQNASVSAASTPGSWTTTVAGTGGGTAAPNFTTQGDIFNTISGQNAVFATSFSIGSSSNSGSGVIINIVSGSTAIVNTAVTITIDGKNANNSEFNVAGTIVFGTTAKISLIDNNVGCKFALASGATLKTANAVGVFGTACSVEKTIGSNPTVNLSTGANYEFNGGAQTMTGMPVTVNNLTFSGTLAKTYSLVAIVTGNFSMSGSATSTPTMTNIGGTIDLSGTAVMTTGATNVVTGSLTVGTGSTLSMGGFSLNIGTTSSITGTVTTVTSVTGTKTFTGAVTINTGGVWNLSGQNPATSFGAGITMSGTAFNNGTGAAAFSATQSLAGANAMTFGGTMTPALGTTLTNSNTGSVILSSTGSIVLTGNFTQGANSNLTVGANSPFSGGGTFNASSNTNTVTYTGTSVAIRPTNYSILTVNGSGTATIGSITAVNGTMTVSSATVNNSTLSVIGALSGVSTLTQGAGSVLNIGGTSGITGLDASTNANSVNYTGAAQTVKAVGYKTLNFNGTGDKTLAATTSVAGNLTITGVKADIGTGLSINVNNLTLGTFGTNTGTWGSTSSAATYQNNTYFTATNGVLTITADTRQTPTVTPTVGTYTYTGLPNGPNSSTNTGTGSSYTFSYSGTGGTIYGPSATQPTNAGTYTITATVAASNDGFYKVNSSSATAFSIGARGLTITADNGSKTYGQTYTVGAGFTAFTPTGLQNGETIGSITIASTGAVNTASVGSYSIIPSAATGGTFTPSNYSITYTNGSLTVAAASLTITANNGTKVYGTSQSTPVSGATTFGSTGLQNGQTIGSVTLTYGAGALTASAAVGATSTITPSAATGGTFTASNYSITYTPNSGTLTVTAAPLTITANNGTKVYGTTQSSPVTGATTFGSTGLQNGETIGSVTLTYGAGALAATDVVGSTSTITPSAATGGTFTASNYNITYTPNSGTLTVTATPLNIAANNASKCFGTIYTLGTSAFVPTGLVLGETVGSVTLSSAGASSGAAVGNYSIVPSAAIGGTFTASNYSITYTNGTLTVNALPTNPSGTNGVICSTGTVNLSASVAGGETVDWYDTSSGGTLLLSSSTSYTTPSISATTTYYAEARNITTGCVSSTRTTVTATVYAAFTTGTISSTGETICNGGTPATTIGSTTAASGGDASITYSWRTSADGYTAAISVATSSTYLPPSGLTTTTSYRRYAKDGSCSTTPTVSSGTWTVTVRPAFTSGTISSTGETICNGGTPATTIGSPAAASGGDASVTYSWRSSADSYAAAISGATNATYLPPAGLTTTTGYRRYAKDGTCNTIPTVSSGTWTVTVRPAFTTGTISSTGETICNGGTPLTTIGSTTAASGGDASITYTWRSSADSYAVAISGATNPTYLPPAGLTATTGYKRYANDSTCNTTPTVSSGTWTVTVNATFSSGAISSTGETICNTGTPAATIGSITAASGGDASITYSWRSSADGYTAAISGATSATYLPPSGLTTTTSFQRYAKDGTCTTTPTVSSGTWTVTVRPVFTSGAINTTGETLICNGGTLATTIGSATASSGGDNTITYSWRSSADGFTAAILGATSTTYLPPSGLTTTTSYRRYAKDGTCNTTPVVSSGTWTVTVNAAFTSGAINTTGETICNGGTPTTTIGSATAASGGDGSITYSWRSSADSYTVAISGATSATYLPPSGLTTTTSYRRYAKDGTCNTTPTVSSGTWTVTVRLVFTTGTISSTGETICNGGTPATTIGSTTASSGGDNTITYSWRSSADGYTAAILGATSATYLPPLGLTTTTSYRRYAKDGTCNTIPTVASGTWTVTVYATFTPGTISNTGETICNGGNPVTTIATITAASGGDGSITYSWRSSVDGYTAAISGATSATYLPPSGLTATTGYRRYAKDGTCNTTPSRASGTWTVTVNATFTSGTISSAGETICNGGTPATTIGSAVAASGGNGSITYLWRSSADGYTAAIAGATTATYLPPSGLASTTGYRRYANDGSCNTTPAVSSGTWTVTVRPVFTTGTISSTGETICNGGTPATTIGSATAASGGDNTITYSWRSSADGYTAAISGATSATYLPPSGLTTTTGYRRYAKDGTCNTTPTAASGTWTVTVRPAFTTGTISSTGETICNGGIPATTIGSTTAASGGDNTITYSWRSSADGYTAAISGAVSTTYLPLAALTTTTSYQRYAKDGTCNTTPTVSSGTWTVTVASNNTAGAASSTPTLCIDTALTTITHSTTGATGIGTAIGLPAGVSATWATNTITISGTPAAAGTFNYSIPLTGGCGSVIATGTITVRAASTSAIITGNALICSGSSTQLQVAITGGTAPYTVVYSTGSVSNYSSGTDITVSPTSTTTYTLTSVTDANGCVGTGNSGSAVVTLTSTSTNDGITWSNGIPSGTKDAIITGNATIAADLAACSLTVNNNAIVTVTSGFNVTLNGALTVSSGSFTLNNTSNLIQNGSGYANSGNIIVKRNSSALVRLDYTLWSSPVIGQGLYAFSPYTLPNRFYSYNTSTNLYSNAVGFNLTNLQYPAPLVAPNGVNGTDSNNIQFGNGKAYLIRVPWDHPTAATVWNGTFTGVPNNGTVSFAMTTGYNAVGNPYPSRINVKDFIDGNTTISGPLYLWRKTNDNTATSYATLTKTAYVANGAAGGDTGTGYFNTGNEANWVLNIGQGFIVNATTTSNLTFTNSMRRSSNADQFFRAPPATVTVTNSGLYWLNLNTDTGIYSQMAVGYSSEGTLAEDRGIDGKNINNEFYLTSLIGTDKYSIQGRPDFQDTDIVPLSYKIATAGNYTIGLDHTAGLFNGSTQAIYLKDNVTTTIINLNTGVYAFTSNAGTFNNRFEIVYQSQLANPSFTSNTVVIYNQNNGFVVNSGYTIMASIKVFDISGRLLQEKTGINANQTTINGGLANEVLLVQITLEDGIVITKKVIR